MSATEPAVFEQNKPQTNVRHIFGWDVNTALCGATIKTKYPAHATGKSDCVVCLDLWYNMTGEKQGHLANFWGLPW